MLIDHVDLENVKSYERASLDFARGTIAICGQNGAGKSTIIEAIGFALFGSQRVRQEQVIREDSAYGRISVRFVSALDQRPYHVTRELRRSGASVASLYSADLDAVIATGVREVQELLAQHLGARAGVKLPVLFEGVVGVPQGQLTSDFLLPPAPRKVRFEELLSLQEYELAYNRLSGPLQYGREQLRGAQGRLSALEEELRAMPEVLERLERLKLEYESLDRQLAQLEAELVQVRARRQELDSRETDLREARERKNACAGAVELARQRLSELERRVSEASAAQSRAEASHSGHDLFLELEAQVQTIEASAAERDRLRGSLHQADKAASAEEATIASLHHQLTECEAAAAQVVELAPLAHQQDDLESRLADLRQQQVLERRARRELSEQQRLLESHRGELAAATAALQDAARVQGELERLAEARDQAAAQVASLTGEYKQVELDLKAITSAAEAVRRGERQVCPSCLRPFEGGDVDAYLRHVAETAGQKKALLEDISRRGHAARAELARIENALRQQQERMNEIAQQQRRLELTQQAIEAVTARLDQLARDLPPEGSLANEIQDLTRALELLGDPRVRLAAAQAQARRVPALRQELQQHEAALESQLANKRATEEALAQYQGLEERLAEARQRREAARADYDSYRRFAPLAAELPLRQAQRDEAAVRLADAERELLLADGQVKQLLSAYDAQVHESLRQRERELEIGQATVAQNLSSLRASMEDESRRLQHLQELEQEAIRLRRSIARGQTALDVISFLRDAIRRSGPEIAKRLLRRVSAAANQLFAQIMGDYATELTWNADYGITLRRGAQTRDFSQLSGGEQMAAALAVRLALLREMSDVGIAFFDEPTVNLDAERRGSLAEQIRNIRGFDQLFVISHDDSLEGVTDHVIHVTKENGISRVEQV